jgi:hypothetical protein
VDGTVAALKFAGDVFPKALPVGDHCGICKVSREYETGLA